MMVNGPNHIDIFLSKKYLLIIIIRCKCNYLKYFSNKCDYLNNAYLHDIGSGKVIVLYHQIPVIKKNNVCK